MKRYVIALFAIAGLSLNSAQAGPPATSETLQSSAEILKELGKDPLKGIPTALMGDAEGVAIIPNVIKAGLVLAGSGGHGMAMVRDKDGNWGDPVFIDFGGASLGLQVGVNSTDVVLVFRKRKSLERILEGKGKLTLGVDSSIAAGPLGRSSSAGTDAKLEAEILSYSRSRGLFAGVAFDGAVINPNTKENESFGRDKREETRKLVDEVKIQLLELGGGKKDLPPMVVPPPALSPVTPLPAPPAVIPVTPLTPPVPPGRP